MQRHGRVDWAAREKIYCERDLARCVNRLHCCSRPATSREVVPYRKPRGTKLEKGLIAITYFSPLRATSFPEDAADRIMDG